MSKLAYITILFLASIVLISGTAIRMNPQGTGILGKNNSADLSSNRTAPPDQTLVSTTRVDVNNGNIPGLAISVCNSNDQLDLVVLSVAKNGCKVSARLILNNKLKFKIFESEQSEKFKDIDIDFAKNSKMTRLVVVIDGVESFNGMMNTKLNSFQFQKLEKWDGDIRNIHSILN